MKEFFSSAWGFWGKWIANPITLWGTALVPFLALSSYNAHAADPEAHIGDTILSFHSPLAENVEHLPEGAALLAGDLIVEPLSWAFSLALDTAIPRLGTAFKAVAGMASGGSAEEKLEMFLA